MASEETSLRALEGLMTEFFHSCTTNERKREIEELLNNFAQQTGAWRHCLFFLSNTRNEYVMMYSLTVFENLVNKMWIGVASQDKMEIRSCLPKLLLAQHKLVPYFIRNKLCKVIVDIGRQDWPMFYHDFFTNTLQLIQSPALSLLGLVMLKTTSEELACPREDLSVSRKDELRKLLLEQVPTVLGLLTGILETYWDKHSVIASTPPPSPTSGESVELLGNLFQGSQYSKLLCQPMAALDNESQQLCCLVLECLAHLFSWIPLSTSITPTLLASIFHFARFGCDIRTKAKTGCFISSNSSSSNGQLNPGTMPPTSNGGGRNGEQTEGSKVDRARLGVLAMTCVNELVSKNCVPMDFEEYLLRMFQQTFFLLQRLTRENNTHTVKTRLQELDESYLEKFTDFLRLFVSVHLRRIESSPQFPIVEFLGLLFKYTFNQPTHEGYFACLDIWSVFLDFLTTKIKSRLADRESVLNRYKDALVLLLREVLNRIQFRYNQAQLEELDDETLDDDLQTEWQRYLRQSLEVVAKVMELLPSHAFTTLFPVLQDNLDVYLGLQQFIVTTGTSRRLNISAENDCRRLHCSLRDLSSLLQAVGRLAEHFIGEVFAARFNDALAVVERRLAWLLERVCHCCSLSGKFGHGSSSMLDKALHTNMLKMFRTAGSVTKKTGRTVEVMETIRWHEESSNFSDVTDEMLAFFLTLFQALRVQMGVAFTGQIIQTFLGMFTREQLAASILQEGSAGCRVVQKFLKILQVVVQEPGQAFKPFLPSILSLCMEQVYPVVAEVSWRSPILSFIWCLFLFAFGLISILKRKTVQKPGEDIRKLFRTSMLFHFINVLVQVLLHKSHDLLQEEITVAIYNMACVDFDAFFSAFMPEFLNGCQGVDASQRSVLARNFKLERDLPSFTQSVQRLVNDLRYYRLCNSSLPTGTIKL
ncbi:exportin-6 [Notothenia coriiceps]|uniref:Exportin-6 n=1 Tax=Notothenia coriiceps TaxID=8208 RepID=A0A6I9MSV3_9TELE|nr:PREDICTED: exportin-6 [Notothenia coriiceps]